MKQKIADLRRSLIALQEESALISATEDVSLLTPRAKSLFERATAQLGDAELNLLKLYRVLPTEFTSHAKDTIEPSNVELG